MEITNITNKDTYGGLTDPRLKIFPDKPSLYSEVSRQDSKYTLKATFNNVDYNAIPGKPNQAFSYRYILSYMGTLGHKGMYEQIVLDESGVLNKNEPPVIEYSPLSGEFLSTPLPEGTVLNVDFYTNEANILQFKDVPVGGNNPGMQNVYRYSYPYTARVLPNSSNNKTYFDGWYKNSYVVFRDIEDGDVAVKGRIYGYRGTTGLAAEDGKFQINPDDSVSITYTEDGKPVVIEQGLVEGTYHEVFMAIWELTGITATASGLFADTQTLVLDEINEAIINEIKNISLNPACDDTCHIADWQKLQQKKIGAFIYFMEGNYRKAQVILESARKACGKNKTYC